MVFQIFQTFMVVKLTSYGRFLHTVATNNFLMISHAVLKPSHSSLAGLYCRSGYSAALTLVSRGQPLGTCETSKCS